MVERKDLDSEAHDALGWNKHIQKTDSRWKIGATSHWYAFFFFLKPPDACRSSCMSERVPSLSVRVIQRIDSCVSHTGKVDISVSRTPGRDIWKALNTKLAWSSLRKKTAFWGVLSTRNVSATGICPAKDLAPGVPTSVCEGQWCGAFSCLKALLLVCVFGKYPQPLHPLSHQMEWFQNPRPKSWTLMTPTLEHYISVPALLHWSQYICTIS